MKRSRSTFIVVLRSSIRSSVIASLAAGLAVGCGGGDAEGPPPATASEAPPPRENKANAPMISQDLGSIDPRAVQQTFERLAPKLNACFDQGRHRIEFLSGDLKFFVRVGQDGAAKYAYIVDSTMGDPETEKCMLDVVSTASWPKPQGGEAEVRDAAIGFDAPGDVRAPTAWSADRIAEQLGKNDDKIRKCKGGVKGTFKATAYVEVDNEAKGKERGKLGRIQSISILPPGREGGDKVECLLDVVTKMKLPSPGSYPAKVSFVL